MFDCVILFADPDLPVNEGIVKRIDEKDAVLPEGAISVLKEVRGPLFLVKDMTALIQVSPKRC